MKRLLYLIVTIILGCFVSCDNSDGDYDGSQHITRDNEAQPYPSDTFIYHAEAERILDEGYTQTLKAVYLSDTTLWFNITYENMMAGGKVEGVATDKYSATALETFTYNEIEHPATAYHYEDKGFHYYILINQQDCSLAKLNIESDIPTDAIPLQIVMQQVRTVR